MAIPKTKRRRSDLPTALWLALLMTSTVCAVGQSGTVVTINADRVLVLNGRKVFPIGFSPGPPTNGKTPTNKDAMQEFHDAGALLFRMAQTANWNSQVIADQQAALDWAYQHGMYGWVNLRELSKFAEGDTATEAALRNIVDTFKNHPALGVWKNFDEAWWGGVPVADLQRGYNVIKQQDTNHPVVQTHAPRGTVSDLQPYNVAADVLALDIYPVGYPPGANSLLANKEISMVGDFTQFLSQVANGQKQYWMIEQIAWSGATPPSKTLRFPSFTEERFMAYQAIINGARGLTFFGGNVAATLNPEDAALGWNWTFWDTVLKRVVQQLGDNSLLADALVAPVSTLPIGLTVATNVEFAVREAPPYLYILACKREGATIQVTFTGLPTTVTTGELLYESPRIVQAQGGQFTDWFGPFEVHAYRFLNTNSPPPPPPPATNALYEPFDYSNVGGPVSVNTPTNWAMNGAGANDLNVASGSLSYSGLPASIGNSVTNGGNGLGVRRLFGWSANSGKLYVSALFRINDLGFGAWNGAASPVGAFTTPDNTTFRLSIVVRSNSPSGYVIGVQKAGTGATATYDTTEYHAGDTVFLVAKYDFTVSPNAVSLWINPTASTFGSSAEPTSGFISATSGTDGAFTIDRFNMRQNTTASVPASMQWDELRVSTAWATVAPMPEAPSALLTDLTYLGDGSFQFTYTNSAGRNSRVYASTNLIEWEPLGTATPIGPGLYRFTDASATNYPGRFYHLRSP
jgi:hypothetical protein